MTPAASAEPGENLRDSPMMAHLLDALEAGTDVGHYGRLTFAMIARHFMDKDALVDLLAKQPDQDADKARAMVPASAGQGLQPTQARPHP
jgi:hypothetical protein